MGPMMPPSMRVKAKAMDNWVRLQPKWTSRATDQMVMA